MKKTEGQKSRDTVPLKAFYCILYSVFCTSSTLLLFESTQLGYVSFRKISYILFFSSLDFIHFLCPDGIAA
jgi:hypothetical protein